MSAVFVSYSRKDAVFAKQFNQWLAERNCEVWIDWEDIPPTAKWWAEIQAGIEASDAFLFLISPDSATSAVCTREVDWAISLNKRIIPVVVRQTDTQLIHTRLQELNWIFFKEETPDVEFASHLLEVIETDLDWVRAHTRLMVRAREWQGFNKDPAYLLRGEDLNNSLQWLTAAAAGKQPPPAQLHYDYINASQEEQAREVARFRKLYRNALARQLAAQATLLEHEADNMLDRSMLLAIESLRRLPNAEADQVLRKGIRLRALEVAEWRQSADSYFLLQASADGQYLATCGEKENEAVVRNMPGFEVVARVLLPAPVSSFMFIPATSSLAIATTGGQIFLFEYLSGTCTLQWEHTGHIRYLMALPDGRGLLSAGEGGAVLHPLNNMVNGWKFSLPCASWTAAFSPDGTRIAIGGADCEIRLADAATGQWLANAAHDGMRKKQSISRGASDAGIAALGFSADGYMLCSAGLDGTLRVWDAITGSPIHTFHFEQDLYCMAVNPVRALVAGGGADFTLRIYDLQTGNETSIVHLQSPVTGLAWSADGNMLLGGCGDGTSRLWTLNEKGGAAETIRCVHKEWVEAVAFPATGFPVALSSDGRAVAWTRGEADWKGRIHNFAIKNLVPDRTGKYLLVFADGETQVLYNTREDFTWRLITHPSFVDDAFFTADNRLITTCWDGLVREYDLDTLEILSSYGHSSRVWKSALSADEKLLASAGQYENFACIVPRQTPDQRIELNHNQPVRSMAFSPDGHLLATSCDDGSVRLWQTLSGNLLWTEMHQGTVWWVDFHPSGQLVAAADEQGKVIIREAQSGKVVQTLDNTNPISSFSWSPDGSKMAVCLSYRGPFEVPVWDIAQNRVVALFAHEELVHSLEWSPDGNLLVTACQDHRIRVFDVPEKTERIRLQYRNICVSAGFMKENGHLLLLATSYDGSLQLLPVNPEELIAMALDRLPGTLTEAEWQYYLPDEK